MVSQLVFGEVFEVLERNRQWLRIHTFSDNYDGWIDEKQVQPITQKSFKELTSASAVITLEPLATAESKFRKLQLSIGTSLPYFEKGSFRINEEQFQFHGAYTNPGDPKLSQKIPEFALKFSEAPYLWGGRSIFGLDCSGFTNIVFKMAGIKLRRDAWQQSEEGILISFVDEARAGDLAFFQNEEGKIIHVGVILDSRKIIHASGRVRIDTLDHYGIFNEEQKKYTHQLRLIKRMIG